MKKTRWNDVVLDGLLAQVERVPDPRTKRSPRHLLTDILVISICGVLSGCEGCVEIAEYGRRKEEFFRTILELPHGIPSHDTFNRVLALLKPQALQECLIGWLRSVRDEAGDAREERQIAIDGKSLRRTFDRAASQNMLHLVSAWSTANGITLGQVAVDEKSNEITAIPQLLQAIDLTNATVTIDAMGCQKNIAKEIINGGGDYLLAVKGNQEASLRIITDALAEHFESNAPPPRGSRHETHETNARPRRDARVRLAAGSRVAEEIRLECGPLDRHGPQPHAPRRQALRRVTLLPEQSSPQRPQAGQVRSRSLEHREQLALGVGHELPRRPLPLVLRPRRRKPRAPQSHRPLAVESGQDRQGRHRLQTQNRRMGRPLPHPLAPQFNRELAAYALG